VGNWITTAAWPTLRSVRTRKVRAWIWLALQVNWITIASYSAWLTIGTASGTWLAIAGIRIQRYACITRILAIRIGTITLIYAPFTRYAHLTRRTNLRNTANTSLAVCTWRAIAVLNTWCFLTQLCNRVASESWAAIADVITLTAFPWRAIASIDTLNAFLFDRMPMT
jgi:hypothetical protein